MKPHTATAGSVRADLLSANPGTTPRREAPGFRSGITGRWTHALARATLVLTALLGTGTLHAFNPGPHAGRVTTVVVQPDDGILLTGEFASVGEESRNGFARLHSDGSVDTSYHVPAVARAASTVAVQPDGSALVAGKGVQGNGGLLRIRADGTLDTTFTDAFTSGSATIQSILPLASGKILVGGLFQTVGGQARKNLARLNADGTLDPTFQPGVEFAWGVVTMFEQPDGRIVVGGYEILHRLLPDGAVDAAQPLAALASSVGITKVLQQPDGKIVVGSDNGMTFSDGVARGNLARINADGSVDTGFVADVTGGIVETLLLEAGGKIVLGGILISVGGQDRSGVARVNVDGTLDETFAPLLFENQAAALSIATQSDGKIVIGGNFMRINGLARGRLARLHPDGRLDNGAAGPLTVTPRDGANGSISPATPQSVPEGTRLTFALVPDPGFAVGSVTGCDGTRSGPDYVTGWIWADCTLVASFVPDGQQVFNPDANGAVEAIALHANDDIAVAGWFNRIGGLRKIKFARLHAVDGSADAAFADGSSVYSSSTGGDVVYATAVQADGKTLFGGEIGGLLRVNADGTLDTGFNVTFEGFATIKAITLQTDGKILVGGNFSSVNGVTRNKLVRLHADGSVDTSFDPGAGPDSQVYALLQQPDGRIVVGGGFATFDGELHFGMARLSATGAVEANFPSANTAIHAIARQADGALLIGGQGPIDLGDGGLAESKLVRLMPSGVRDSTFEAIVSGGRGEVHAIAERTDGSILVAGEFDTVNGQSRPWLTQLRSNGTLDDSFTTVPINSVVATLAVQADDKIVIGGRFTTVDGYSRNSIARLKSDGQIDVDAFVVTPLAGANGMITPNAPQSVEPGAQASFTIVPDPGFVIGPVSGCDGSLDGLVYTTAPVTDHCSITIDFLMDSVSYNVTPAAGPNGQFWPSTPQPVLFAQTTSFDVAADAGYYIAAVEGCQGALSGSTYTTGRILADCAVIARFGRPTTLAASEGTPQTTAVGTLFPQALGVRITDASGAPLAGVPVTFAAPASGASAELSSTSAVTDPDGRASIEARANGNGGAYAITATVDELQATFALTNEALDRGGLDFKVTVSRDPPPACGTATEIDAVPGEQLNYCFTVTNRSDVTLTRHTLTLITFGYSYQYHTWFEDRFLNQWERPLAAGETLRYHRLVSAGTDDQAPLFTWSATASEPDYEKDADAEVAFTDISATGTALTLGAISTFQLESLPFPITYFGDVFLEGELGNLCINNSGTVSLRRGGGEEACPSPSMITVPPLLGDNEELPAIGFPFSASNGLAVYWDLLGSRGKVYHATVGEAPNRRFIVQWDGKDHANSPNPSQGITFQLVFEETTGKIHYVYRNLRFDVVTVDNPDNGGSATVGLVGYTYQFGPEYAPPFRQHSLNQPVLHEGQSITWTPTAVPRYASASVGVDVGAPHIGVSPAAVTARLAPGEQSTHMVSVGNSGDTDLVWSLEEAAARAHFPPANRAAFVPPVEDEARAAFRMPGRGMASQPDTPTGLPSVLAVPAYGFSGTYLNGVTRGAVSFDASNPTQLVHGVGVPYVAGDGIWAADFVGDDFSQVYVFGYAAEGAHSYDFSLGRSDTASYATTWIGNAVPEAPDAPPSPRWSGTAWDGTTQTLFAVTTGYYNCESANVSDLYSVDPQTAATVRIGNIDAGQDVCIRGLAVAPDGAMYGIDDFSNTLVAIDKHTGEAAIVGWLGFNINGQISADFDDAAGTLYLATGGAIYTVDLVTGLASVVGALPPVFGTPIMLEGLSIAVNGGTCTLPSQIPWLSVNQSAGATSPGAQSRIDLTVDATGLAAGTHSATVCIFSNDRSHSLVRVPVDVTVGAPGGNALFADGFE